MFHYLFTNDLRITMLDESLKKAGHCFLTDTVPSAQEDKSANNNMMTLGFYFNLSKNSNCAKVAASGNVRAVVLNFIKKFQFPNMRTSNAYEKAKNDGIQLVPMRLIVKLLYTMNLLHDIDVAFLTKEEIKYFIFYNESVAKNKNPDLNQLINEIFEYRKTKNFPPSISVNEEEHEWKHEDRQIREMLKVLLWSGCVSEKDGNYVIDNDHLSVNNKSDVYDIITCNSFWEGSTIDSYHKYMDINEDYIFDYAFTDSGKNESEIDDIITHNLFGIHIKNKNDALSAERPHICIGWSAMGDLSSINDINQLGKLYDEHYEKNARGRGQDLSQIWCFLKNMNIGDYVIFAENKVCHVGRIDSEYYYDSKIYPQQSNDYVNNRSVKWIKTNIDRNELSEQFHNSLKAARSVWTLNDYKAAVLDLVRGSYKKDENVDYEEDIQDLTFMTNYRSKYNRNRIIFGAPGTGKSYTLNIEVKELLSNGGDYERVTFHPDYSYANFVGTYKPVMVDNSYETISSLTETEVVSVLTDTTKTAQEKYDLLFDKFKDEGLVTRLPLLLGIYTDENFKTRKLDGSESIGDNNVERNHGKAIRPYVNLSKPISKKKDISYEYVPGPFMRILVKALNNAMTDNPKPYLLIIEEINRANVAAVFGEVFQLLDRDSDGVSEYKITTTNDMRRYLSEQLGVEESKVSTIKIPNNMFIWATMNSADQGVFPMDTAFKRRWDFTYLGIDDCDEKIRGKYVYLAEDKSQKVEWNKLRKAINNFLAKSKINEDKQLGPYFISKDIVVPENGDEIDRDKFIKTFKNKVIMYLFEDAAKQKQSKLFEGCFEKCSRYSEICKEFEKKGVGIFNSDIQIDCEIEEIIPEIGNFGN